MAPWVPAAIAGGSMLAGAGISAYSQISAGKASGSALKSATKSQIKAAEKAEKKTRKDFKPYREAGYQSLYDLTGFEKVSNITDEMRSQYDSDMEQYEQSVSDYKSELSSWRDKYRKKDKDGGWKWKGKYSDKQRESAMGLKPTKATKPGKLPKEEWTYQKTGKAFDITGGAQKYMDAIEAIDTGASDKYMKAMEGIDVGAADKYMKQIEGLDFRVDENDPNYQWRQKEGTKAIDAFAASRGLHNSSYTADRLADFSRDLSGDEVDRQYEQNYLRKYGQLTDLYNMANKQIGTKIGQQMDLYNMANQGVQRQMGQQTDLYNMAMQGGAKQYGALIDVAQMGLGAVGGSGSASQAAGQQIGSAYKTEGLGLAAKELYQGDVKGSFWSGAGGMPLNAMTAYGYGNQAQQGSPYLQGSPYSQGYDLYSGGGQSAGFK